MLTESSKSSKLSEDKETIRDASIVQLYEASLQHLDIFPLDFLQKLMCSCALYARCIVVYAKYKPNHKLWQRVGLFYTMHTPTRIGHSESEALIKALPYGFAAGADLHQYFQLVN